MLVLLADDLTGALDAAAPFAGRGLATEVVLAPSALAAALSSTPEVLSVNIRTRELGADAARAATAAVLRGLPKTVRLFKKIDSRLKGHIAGELDATDYRKALVAPAIPEFGRLVEAGHVRGFGVAEPLSIAAALGRHADRSIIPDTAGHEDLAAALEDAENAGVDLLVGARGLAEALAVRMTNGRAAAPVAVPPGRGLFVVGSRDPITLAQIDRLRQDHAAHCLPAPNGLLGGAEHAHAAEHRLTLVQAVAGRDAIAPVRVSQHLAASVHPQLTGHADTLLLSGGTTAEAVLEAMGIERFRLLGECLPGLGIARAGAHCIIAKSGGFGGPDTLSQIAAQLAGEVD